MPMNVTCPRCGYSWTLDVSLSGTEFVGNRMNIVAPCPRCDHEWDLTGGGDGTWETTPAGGLRKVSEHLESLATSELQELRERIVKLEAEKDERRAMETLSALGVDPPKGGWFSSRENRQEIWTVLALVSTIILGILALR